MSKKIIQEKYPNAVVKKAFLKDYNFEVIIDGVSHYIKKLPISRNTILTINSKHIWNIKKGRADGVSFKTGSSTLIKINEFNKLTNKIIVFNSQPYKILKYLNESDIIDISNDTEINEIRIFNSFKKITF